MLPGSAASTIADHQENAGLSSPKPKGVFPTMSAKSIPPAASSDKSTQTAAVTSWRDHLKVHPAAELFPRMTEAELRELGEDIKRNG